MPITRDNGLRSCIYCSPFFGFSFCMFGELICFGFLRIEQTTNYIPTYLDLAVNAALSVGWSPMLFESLKKISMWEYAYDEQ